MKTVSLILGPIFFIPDNATEDNPYYITIEEEDKFAQCFTETVQCFEELEKAKKMTKGKEYLHSCKSLHPVVVVYLIIEEHFKLVVFEDKVTHLLNSLKNRMFI